MTDLLRQYAEKSIRAYLELKESILREIVPAEIHDDPVRLKEFGILHDLRVEVHHEYPDEERLWFDGKLIGTFIKSTGLKHTFVPHPNIPARPSGESVAYACGAAIEVMRARQYAKPSKEFFLGAMALKVCRDCNRPYDAKHQTDVCPHISTELPMNPTVEILIMREGYRYARSVDQTTNNWFRGVNNCPYGPGVPGNPRANAWYSGWWFYWYVVKRWSNIVFGVK